MICLEFKSLRALVLKPIQSMGEWNLASPQSVFYHNFKAQIT